MKQITFILLITLAALVGVNVQAEDYVKSQPNLLTKPFIIQSDFGFQGLDLFEKKDFKPTGNYTIEVISKVNGTEGRGMDVQALDANGNGIRVVSSEMMISNYSNLFSPVAIDINDNTQETTLRYVVKDSILSIYKNDAPSAIVTDEPMKIKPGYNSAWSEDFSNGFSTKGNWIVTGAITVTPVTEIVYFTDATTSVTAFSDVEAIKVQTWGDAGTMKLKYPVTPGTYKLFFKSHAYVKAGDGGLMGIKNLSVRVFNHGTTQQYGAAWVNGHTGNVNTVPRWNPTTIEFVVPDTCQNIDISLVRSNQVQVYLDDFELVRVSDKSADILAGVHDMVEKKGIYSDFNLLKDLNPGFEMYQHRDSNNIHVEWVTNFAKTDSMNYMITKTKDPRYSSNQEGLNVGELFINRLDSTEYISYKIPSNTMQSGVNYRLRFSYGNNSGTTWSNFKFAMASNPDGTGTAVLPFRNLGVAGNNTLDRIGDFKFKCPDASKDYYLVFMKNVTSFSINIDRFFLEKDESYPLNTLRVGKLFYHGAADIEISSIKYVDGAYAPGASGVKQYKELQSAYYQNGMIHIQDAQNEQLKVYNITGNVLVSQTVNGTMTVPVNLTKGVYIMTIDNKVRKFIIN